MPPAPDRAPNRALILEDARYWLGTITEANGYPLTVAAVGSELLTAEEVGENLPYLAVCPAVSSPPPKYEYGGGREVFFDFVVVGHVRADTPNEREVAIAGLEQAVADVLQIDPRRDGWSVDTVQVTGPLSDEGVPSREARGGMVASFSTTYRTNFHPQDEAERPMAQGEIYIGTPAITTVGVGVFAAIAGTTISSPGPPAVLVDCDSPANGRLRYTGLKGRWFLVQAIGSVVANAGGALVEFELRKTTALGVTTAQVKSSCLLVSGANAQPFTCKALIYLDQNDYVDLAVTGSGGTLTVNPLNLSITQVPKF